MKSYIVLYDFADGGDYALVEEKRCSKDNIPANKTENSRKLRRKL